MKMRIFVAAVGVFATMLIVEAAETNSANLNDVIPTSKRVMRPPKIEKGPNGTDFRQYTKITMECEATGTPRPTFTWEKNGKPFYYTNNPDITSPRQGSGTFTINEPRKGDSGAYQCFVKNKYGETFSQNVTIRSSEFQTLTDTSVVAHTGQQGSFFKLPCKGLKSYPPPQYTWVVTESVTATVAYPVVEDNRVSIDHQGNLLFANLQPGDARNGNLYKCNIYNYLEDTTRGGSYSRITVTAGRGSTGQPVAPQLRYHTPSPKTVLRGDEKAELQCFFSGNPTPLGVAWRRKDGQALSRNHDTSAKPHTLVFTQIIDENEGEYECFPAGNQNLATTVTLYVDVKPTWKVIDGVEQKPKDVNVTVGGNHTFVCDGDAKPGLTKIWYIDTVPVTALNLRAGVEISPDMNTFTVRDVQKDRADGSNDLMNVQCSITNKHGQLIGGAYLNVIMPTKISPHAGPQNWNLVYREPIIFNCEGISDPSTPVKVTWFWNKRPINLADPDITQLKNDSLMIVTENKEQSGAEFAGEYECVVSNGYSEDQASAMLILPEGPIPEPKTASILDMWWIFVIIAVVLLLLLLLLCCCLCYQRNKGDSYFVDEKERKNGNDPEKELADSGFRDYQRPEETPMKGSRASLNTSLKMDSDDDGSLAEYGDIDAGKFNEDGSFIGQYADQKPQDTNHEPPPYSESKPSYPYTDNAQTPLRGAPGGVRVLPVPVESDV